MPLSNSQYDAIMREYGRRQIENRHELEERRQIVYKKLPVIKDLEAEIAHQSVASAKRLLEGDAGAMGSLKETLQDLKEQKSLLMEAAGFSKDCLELHFSCPDCQDTGFIEGRKCHCFLQAQMKLLYAQSNLQDVLERENFSALTFEYYDDKEILPQIGITNAAYMRRVIQGCRDFVDNFGRKHENLLFTGGTGVGKTFLTNCIAKELMEQYHPVIYLTAGDLFEVFSRNKFDYENAEDMKDMYRFILDCDLLIIDDLGTELNNSFTSSQLFYCINERMNLRRSTIISTNLTLTRLRDSYTDRVTSRIMSGYRIIPLYGNDIRLLKK